MQGKEIAVMGGVGSWRKQQNATRLGVAYVLDNFGAG